MANFVVTTIHGDPIKISHDADNPGAVANHARANGVLLAKERIGTPGSHQAEEPIAILASAIVAIRPDRR